MEYNVNMSNGNGAQLHTIPEQMKKSYYRILPHVAIRDEITDESDYKYLNNILTPSLLSLLLSVKHTCDKLDYPGSIMYDEYPDKESILNIAHNISGENNPDTTAAVLCSEMAHRRRNKRTMRCIEDLHF